MEKMTQNVEVFTIKNGSLPLDSWVFQTKNEETVPASIEDLEFINCCKDGYYEPYDGMKVKASYELSGGQILIKKVYLMG